MRGNGIKMRVDRFRLCIAKISFFFYCEGDETMEQASQKVVDGPSLEVLTGRLERALSNLILWKVSLPLAGSWTR